MSKSPNAQTEIARNDVLSQMYSKLVNEKALYAKDYYAYHEAIIDIRNQGSSVVEFQSMAHGHSVWVAPGPVERETVYQALHVAPVNKLSIYDETEGVYKYSDFHRSGTLAGHNSKGAYLSLVEVPAEFKTFDASMDAIAKFKKKQGEAVPLNVDSLVGGFLDTLSDRMKELGFVEIEVGDVPPKELIAALKNIASGKPHFCEFHFPNMTVGIHHTQGKTQIGTIQDGAANQVTPWTLTNHAFAGEIARMISEDFTNGNKSFIHTSKVIEDFPGSWPVKISVKPNQEVVKANESLREFWVDPNLYVRRLVEEITAKGTELLDTMKKVQENPIEVEIGSFFRHVGHLATYRVGYPDGDLSNQSMYGFDFGSRFFAELLAVYLDHTGARIEAMQGDTSTSPPWTIELSNSVGDAILINGERVTRIEVSHYKEAIWELFTTTGSVLWNCDPMSARLAKAHKKRLADGELMAAQVESQKANPVEMEFTPADDRNESSLSTETNDVLEGLLKRVGLNPQAIGRKGYLLELHKKLKTLTDARQDAVREAVRGSTFDFGEGPVGIVHNYTEKPKPDFELDVTLRPGDSASMDSKGRVQMTVLGSSIAPPESYKVIADKKHLQGDGSSHYDGWKVMEIMHLAEQLGATAAITTAMKHMLRPVKVHETQDDKAARIMDLEKARSYLGWESNRIAGEPSHD